MSKIILLRHAKVIIDNPKIYSNQMGEFIKEYNSAQIENAEPSSRVKELVKSADVVVTSKLSRTIKTVKLFNKEPNFSSEILMKPSFHIVIEDFLNCQLKCGLQFLEWLGYLVIKAIANRLQRQN